MQPLIKKFLFDHLTPSQVVAKNTFWLSSTEVISRVLKFFLIIFVARVLGPTEYGGFTFALAFVSFFAIFGDMGLTTFVIREFARDAGREREFSSIFTLKIFLSAVVVAITVLGSFVATDNPSLRLAIWIFAGYIFVRGLTDVLYAVFQARQRMEYVAWAETLSAFLLFLFGMTALSLLPSVKAVSSSYLVASFLGFLFTLWLFHRRLFHVDFSFALSSWKSFLAISWPFGLAAFSWAIMAQIDSVTLGFFGQLTQNGWYSAAYAIFGTVLLPGVIIGQSFFPAISRALNESKDALRKAYHLQVEAMVFFAFAFLAGGLVLSPKLIDFLYDPSYLPGALALQILIAAAVLFFLFHPAHTALIAANHQRKVFLITLTGATVNAVLDIVLIPSLSLYGTALATFVSFAVMGLLFAFYASKYVTFASLQEYPFLPFARALLAGAATFAVLLFPPVYNLHVVPAVFVGGFVYAAVFFSFRMLMGIFSEKLKNLFSRDKKEDDV